MIAEIPILLLGANGQVGHELQAILSERGPLVALTSAQLDLTRRDDIRSVVRRIRPRIIVNAAAYTAVDRAETDVSAAQAVNALAPGVLAEEARRAGAAIVHYSTDFVFDGRKSTAYTENDLPNPLNVYGRSKLEGELAVGAIDVPSLIFRTSWVYAQRGKNFLLTMQKLLRAQTEVKVVNDQFGAPTWARAIARATIGILSLGGEDVWNYIGARRGLYHMTAGGRTSWYGFAGEIARDIESCGERAAAVVGIPSSAYVSAALRPANSVLDNRKLAATFGHTIGHWRDGLADCLADASPELRREPSL